MSSTRRAEKKGNKMMARNRFSVNIFFDESEKQSEKIHLMGAVLVPEKIYECEELQRLNDVIRGADVHWADYSGHRSMRERIKRLILTAMKYQRHMKMNVISYNQNKIESDAKGVQKWFPNVVDQTIYTKFPERVVYGLIRKYGQHTLLDVSVFIEHDNTYQAKEYDLSRQMFEQLNVQSIYRGESFQLSRVDYLKKQQEYGIELTDLLLGIVRTVLENNDGTSKRKSLKNDLVVELLEDTEFYEFMSRIKLFEWGRTNELIDTPFKNYLDIFLSEHTVL